MAKPSTEPRFADEALTLASRKLTSSSIITVNSFSTLHHLSSQPTSAVIVKKETLYLDT
jgi:hypothetical protein